MASMESRRTFRLRRCPRLLCTPLVALLVGSAVALLFVPLAQAQSGSDPLSSAFEFYRHGQLSEASGAATAIFVNPATTAPVLCHAYMIRGAIAVQQDDPPSSVAGWFAKVINACPDYKPPTDHFPDGHPVMIAWNEFMATQSVDVTVICNPPCHLFMDDQFKGIQTSLKLEDLRPAKYTIEALWRPSSPTSGSCWPAERRTVTVTAGEPRREREERFDRPSQTVTPASSSLIAPPVRPEAETDPLLPGVKVVLSVLAFSAFMYFMLAESGLI